MFTPCPHACSYVGCCIVQQFNLIKLDALNGLEEGATVNFDSLREAGEVCVMGLQTFSCSADHDAPYIYITTQGRCVAAAGEKGKIDYVMR